ncbi:MAG: Asp23/Gls24 family envelope stress response protein [Lachnospiraceae bacterium]|nr:Asp23/Gls24 family envelope stress response protein [Lachnospiraceae bacterium]
MTDKKNIIGDVKISENVVASIAGLAASEVDGVVSLAGNLTNEIVAKIGVKNNSKGIKIRFENRTVFADVYINIKYGFGIPDVSEKVQERVKSAIENMTGVTVSDVNVRIVGVIV